MKHFRLFVFLVFLFPEESSTQVLKRIVFDNGSEIPTNPKILIKRGATQGGGLYLRTAPPARESVTTIHTSKLQFAVGKIERLSMNESGNPDWIEFKSNRLPDSEASFETWLQQTLQKDLGLVQPQGISVKIISNETDEMQIQHLRCQHQFMGLDILDYEFIAHLYPGQKVVLHGQLMVPEISTAEKPDLEFDLKKLLEGFFNQRGITITEEDSQAHNLISKSKKAFWLDSESKIWHKVLYMMSQPNPAEHWELMIDLSNGKILKSLRNICKLHHHHSDFQSCNVRASEAFLNHQRFEFLGPETGTGLDLSNTNRTFGVWKEGSLFYLMDASRAMFNAGSSRMPSNPVGAIMTLDAKNTSPFSNGFKAEFITNTGSVWNFKAAISAHYNAGKAYDYYLNNFNRNSISGNGDNILSFVNVVDENGRAMDNAFWNGKAMFYGNGSQAFLSLPKALDVAGHELTHGVIQNTANLIYENEPGAINESFADIFGVMIDRDDWTVGEDVVQKSFFPTGALRSLMDPHNGGTSRFDNGYQPKHVREQYFGTDDNGGVHINSGIPNHAFYLFVQKLRTGRTEEEAKKMAEKIYYHALTRYLMRSSNFKDLRKAIESSCIDLFPANNAVLTSAQSAFDDVGILGSTTTPPANRDIAPNPGKEFLVCTDRNLQGVYLYDFTNQPITLSSREIISKPSVTDDGTEIFYVGEDKKLYYLQYNQNSKTYEEFLVDDTPVYRNVSISKDGRLLAILYSAEENKIHIYDFVKQEYKAYTIYNPTTAGGATFDVKYADQMDFDLSGTSLMYDAFTEIQGSGIEYWDIGFLRVFNKSSNTFGDGQITKLISSLPENTSVGNPVFSKNSPDIIAFDYIESDFFQTDYALLGANTEDNVVSPIADNRDKLAYPSFSVKDNVILFDGTNSNQVQSLNARPLKSSKIESSGQESVLLNSGKWGTWFALGSRKLVDSKNLESIRSLIVNPNPFHDELVIDLESEDSHLAELFLIDPLGHKSKIQYCELQEGFNKIYFNTAQFRPGFYVLVVQNSKGSANIKLIKQ